MAVSLNLTVEDLGVALWALDAASRFGLTFFWSGEHVTVRGWSALKPHERAPFEACRPAIRALLTPDASGHAGLDYIRDLEPPEEQTIKAETADKIAALAVDHRGNPATRKTAWLKLHEGGALKPIEPRLPPPETPKPRPDYDQPGWREREPKTDWAPPPPEPKQPPPRGCKDWSEAWGRFRHKANWSGEKGHRTTTMSGFRVVVHSMVKKRSDALDWCWFVEAPDGRTKIGNGERHESGAFGSAWRWMKKVGF